MQTQITQWLMRSENSVTLYKDKDRHIYLINDLLKVHLHSAAFHIFVLIRAVNQHWELFWPDLLSSVSKHKKHWIYHVGLPTSIWTNDARKALRKGEGKKEYINKQNKHINYYVKRWCRCLSFRICQHSVGQHCEWTAK